MPITAPPTIPQITDPNTFAPRAQDWVVWQAQQLYPFINEISELMGLSTSSTSVTSNTIGLGSKTFTVETNKGYISGQSLSIASTSSPTNRMFAVVTGYVIGTGELTVTVQAVEGSGTYTDWSIALAFNGVIGTSQIAAESITEPKLAQDIFDALTTVTFDPDNDYVAIADGSDSGNKKKALLNLSTNAISQEDSKAQITDTGANGQYELVIDNIVRERKTASARLSTIDGGSTLFPEFKCRAWVNFNGTGTVAIRASGNVSSITDNGTGDYTVNFATAMPDADYNFVGACAPSTNVSNGVVMKHFDFNLTESALRIRTVVAGTGFFDSTHINVSVFI
jgi:hypothetical protein